MRASRRSIMPALFRRARSLAARDGGQAMVEMALGLLLLLFVVFGILIFGILLNNYIELTNAVAMGNRMITQDRGATDPCNDAAVQIQRAAPFMPTSGMTISYTFYDTDGTTVKGAASGTSCTAQATNLVAGGSVKLQISYPCNLNVLGNNYWSACTLIARSTESIQ